MSGRVIAGVGLRRGCPADDLVAVIRRAEGQAGHKAAALAAPAFKHAEPGLRQAAAALGLTLLLIDADALAEAQPRCPTSSARALAVRGISSVAEGSALAAAGPGGRLLLPRIAAAHATCALAKAAS